MTSKHSREKPLKHSRRHARHKLETALSDDDKSLISSLIKKKGKIAACQNCGGMDLSDPPGGEKASKTGMYYCIDCGFVGEPEAFSHEKAYETFFCSRREKYNADHAKATEKRRRPLAHLKEELIGAPTVAAWLSVFLPGLGQAYNNQMLKGGSLALIYLLLIYLMYSVFSKFNAFLPPIRPFIATALLILIYSSGDAYFVALRKLRMMY